MGCLPSKMSINYYTSGLCPELLHFNWWKNKDVDSNVQRAIHYSGVNSLRIKISCFLNTKTPEFKTMVEIWEFWAKSKSEPLNTSLQRHVQKKWYQTNLD